MKSPKYIQMSRATATPGAGWRTKGLKGPKGPKDLHGPVLCFCCCLCGWMPFCANVALFISLRINKFYLVTVLMKSAGPKRGDFSGFRISEAISICFFGLPRGHIPHMPHVSPVCLYSSRNRTALRYCIFTHTHTPINTHSHTH